MSSNAPGIRLLEGEAIHSRAQFAEWDGLDQLHNLEAISVGWAVHLKAEEVARASNLRFLYFGTGGIQKLDPGLPALQKKTGLQTLFNLNPNLPAATISGWAESGGLAEVDSCKTYGSTDFTKLPSLRYLFLRRKPENRGPVDFSSLQKLVHLRCFSLDLPSQEELAQIGQLANCEQIEGLNLWNGSFHDASVLRSLRNLRRLEIRGHDGPLRQLDLKAFPKLEIVYLSGNQDLLMIEGVVDHPSLQFLELALNEGLTSLGRPQPNSTLRALRIQGCPDLPNLDAFSECTGLRQVVITDCDGLTGPLPFEEKNSLEYYTVTKCAHLPERPQQD